MPPRSRRRQRASHRRSRNGCQNCKNRHRRCDEKTPVVSVYGAANKFSLWSYSVRWLLKLSLEEVITDCLLCSGNWRNSHCILRDLEEGSSWTWSVSLRITSRSKIWIYLTVRYKSSVGPLFQALHEFLLPGTLEIKSDNSWPEAATIACGKGETAASPRIGIWVHHQPLLQLFGHQLSI